MKKNKNYIYLDHNATRVVRPEVCAAMASCYERPYNASAIHSLGREAKSFLGEMRTLVSHHIDCKADSVFFTSGGTESNNIVLQSARWEQILCSSTEHDSVYKGPINQVLPVLSSGLLDLDALHESLKNGDHKKTLISIHWANNETGVIQPIQQIAEIVHHYGAWIHVDGVQILGKIPFSFQVSGIDFLSLSAHKMGGPQGVGALIVKKENTLSPLFFGGGQERSLRAGTENVAGIVGFGQAVRQIDFSVFSHLRRQHEGLEEELLEFSEKHKRPLFIIGKGTERLPNTTCFSMPGVSNQSQLIYFDLEGVGVSIGSACSSSTVKPSRVLTNMGLPNEIVGSAVRISSGWNTTESDFLRFKKVWKALFLKHSE